MTQFLSSLVIEPSGPLRGRIRPPGSKSITNRALVCAALANGKSTLRGVLQSDDTQVMIEALRNLGVAIIPANSSDELVVRGCSGRFSTKATGDEPLELFIGNSGTSVRFLSAMLAAAGGSYRLDGVERMRLRPIQDLLDAITQLGGNAVSEYQTGCPPVVIRSHGLAGGEAAVRGDISSQYLSGLLMAAPLARRAVTLHVQGRLVSQPYVWMTLGVMRPFGVAVTFDENLRRFEIPPQPYQPADYKIEPDASAASYFFAAAAISGGEVTVEGLSRDSLQGDVKFVDVLGQMGCDVEFSPSGIAVRAPATGALRGIDVNMIAVSDTVQTLAAVALFADGPTTITGVAHIRHKETDRIGDLAKELRRLGAVVDEFDDGLRISPPQSASTDGGLHGAEIETYDDHRMAMALSLVGLRIPGVVILNPGCTAKTYPGFFGDLKRLT